MVKWGRAFAVWVVIIAAETVHGILRTLILQPVVGDFRARQIAVFTGVIIILAVVYLFIPWLGGTSTPGLLLVGLLWLVLTVLFELGLGRLILRLPWDRIASDYDLSRGGLLSIGLMFLLLSPLIASRFLSRRRVMMRNDGRRLDG